MTSDDLFKPKGDYRLLIAFQKAECVYDVTYHFVKNYLHYGDRTIDQMLQAARSCKQNIVEGNVDSPTSSETEIKLYGVARGSLAELLNDYHDYLRTRNLEIWQPLSEKAIQARRVCAMHNESAFYREAVAKRNDEATANIAITLIHQTDTLLGKLIKAAKEKFLSEGGVREAMARARVDARRRYDDSQNKQK